MYSTTNILTKKPSSGVATLKHCKQMHTYYFLNLKIFNSIFIFSFQILTTLCISAELFLKHPELYL